ncbi:GNAT family N-acetyltransferase [Schaalia sp. Marseille-Q2122]|uniref:GNAT family N-acetyltransferase n=1 Tax=Schaalia sp. Marseille-Q2122 TaxID=2736604 RepID=UPI001C37A9AA|nr:GNAT family N-acetyltransferase [Schaalia sp. Marseille-Q2122]
MTPTPAVASHIRIEPVTTAQQRRGMVAVRWEVFVEEQDVPMVLEIDARDFCSDVIHLVAIDEAAADAFPSAVCVREPDVVVGTVRIIPDGGHHYHLGRLAVLARARGQAVGAVLVEAVHDYVRMLTPAGVEARIVLDAQLQARGFYERLGYRATSDKTFWDAGIEHCEMAISVHGGPAGERAD